MKKEIKTIEKDGYNGVYWPNPNGGKCGIIAMLGDDTKDLMAKGGVKEPLINHRYFITIDKSVRENSLSRAFSGFGFPVIRS